MNKIVLLCVAIIIGFIVYYFAIFSQKNQKLDNTFNNNTKIEDNIILVFKQSMKHWNLDYDSLPANKSGAACIPWQEINKNLTSEYIFEALGYGFNLFDETIGEKAAMEGCNRMRTYHKLHDYCNCEMVLFNNESRIKVPENAK
mgnify:FL=1